tara:strand:- start:1269 stop:1496 length:228 start_codon:yes stop_codon:yes gene_type:complete
MRILILLSTLLCVACGNKSTAVGTDASIDADAKINSSIQRDYRIYNFDKLDSQDSGASDAGLVPDIFIPVAEIGC